jgi:hypothetical protein
MKRLLSIMVLWGLTLMVSQVWAHVISTSTNSIAFNVGAGPASCVPPPATILVPLNNAGRTFLPFVTTQDNQRVVITFSAECSVKASNFRTWLNIDILVDGVEIQPTQSPDNALCTSHNTDFHDGWVGASTTGVFVVPEPGLHTVQIRASLRGCNNARDDRWHLDDSSTIIHSN